MLSLYNVEIEPKSLCMLDQYSTSWATSPARGKVALWSTSLGAREIWL